MSVTFNADEIFEMAEWIEKETPKVFPLGRLKG